VRAAVIKRYGSPDVVKIVEVPKAEPRQGEVLIRVRAAAVGRTDCGMLRAHPFFMRVFTGLLRPKRSILGMEFAGEVEALGDGVTALKPGDRVFGMCPSRDNGAHAEFVHVPEDAIAAMPARLNFDEAVLCEGAFYANGVLNGLKLRAGHSILIYGASGAIGTAAVQLAKSLGAVVTAVVAGAHLDLMKSLGADRVIDYTAEDFTRIEERFDFVLDAVGKTTYLRCRRLLKPDSVFAATDMGPWGQTLVLTIWSAITRSGRVVVPLPGRIKGFPVFLKNLMEAGKLRAVIDRKYPLDKIADAYRYVETGQKVGIVVIDVVPATDNAARTG
jgi:NADPH:quinone reductase-like Zn-dependent oxidoreductase